MNNELILVFSLIFIYSTVLLSFVFFGEKGMICFLSIATITANIEVLILIKAFGMEQTLGNILFASTFLVTDILSEIYGKKAASQAVNIGIFISVIFVILSQSWLIYTPAESDIAMEGIKAVFTNTPRIIIVGLVVYCIVQRFDVYVYHKWWEFTEKRFGSKRSHLWLRNNGSTLISQVLNTALFTIGAFWGVFDKEVLFSIAVSSYIIFAVTSIADTPIIYLVRMIHEKRIKLT